MTNPSLSPNEKEWVEERAAIMEFDGRMSRPEAERKALADLAFRKQADRRAKAVNYGA